MLGVCRTISNSKSQSSIRHKVRKLRAKVRTLIPNDICQSHKKRNQQVEKINFRREQENQFKKQNQQVKLVQQDKYESKTSSMWRTGLLRVEQWFTQKPLQDPHIDSQHYQFNKLSKQQIQQINQDKMYYLGQKNIDTYNNFLKTLKTKIYDEEISRKKQIQDPKSNKITERQNTTGKQIFSMSVWDQNHNRITRKQKLNQFKTRVNSRFTTHNHANLGNQSHTTSSLTNKFKLKGHRDSVTSITKWNTEKDMKNLKLSSFSFHRAIYRNQHGSEKNLLKTIEKRKQQVQQDQKQKRLYQKIRMDMQLAKAQANKKQIQYKQFFKIKQMQDSQKQKIEKALKKKSILLKKGQIVKFNQQLRAIVVRRRQNRQQNGRSNSCIFEGGHQFNTLQW